MYESFTAGLACMPGMGVVCRLHSRSSYSGLLHVAMGFDTPAKIHALSQ